MISSDRFNRSRIKTVMVAAITSNSRLSRQPGNVALPDELLPKLSVINVTAVFTVDRDQLVDHLTDLPALEVRALDDGLRLVLSLGECRIGTLETPTRASSRPGIELGVGGGLTHLRHAQSPSNSVWQTIEPSAVIPVIL